MIIDCHCHAGKGDGLTGPWDTDASLQYYLRWADQYSITHTNLFSAFHSNYGAANEHVGRLVIKYPERFFGFAFVHALRDAGRIGEMIRRAVGEYNFCGIKVHRGDARISREVCHVARKFSIPVLYDPMGEIATVELIAREYADVNFIIPHLSSFADDWKSQVGFISMLERYPNLYADTSGVRRFDVLLECFHRAGAGKILYGSDGPWLHPGVELEKIKALPASQADREKMLFRNFLKLTRSGRVSRPLMNLRNTN